MEVRTGVRDDVRVMVGVGLCFLLWPGGNRAAPTAEIPTGAPSCSGSAANSIMEVVFVKIGTSMGAPVAKGAQDPRIWANTRHVEAMRRTRAVV